MAITAPEQEMARQNAAGHITLRDSLSFQTSCFMLSYAAAGCSSILPVQT